MNDPISRRAAIDAIFSEPLYESGMKKRDADVVVPAIYEKIRSLPSAQPEPVKHGKWVAAEYNDGTVRTECSACGYGRGLPPVRNYYPKLWSEDGLMSYESPITAFFEQAVREIDNRQTEYAVQYVNKMGIDVNKDELIKALAYDRGQYWRGFQDGVRHGIQLGKLDVLHSLMNNLNIAANCLDCPRWDGRCKGNLSWLCRKIREAINDET